MHCNRDSFSSWIADKIPFVNSYYFDVCDSHIQHHLEVEPNMEMQTINDKTALFMGWRIFIPLFLMAFVCFLLAKWISRIKITYMTLIITSLIVTFVWQYIWNKTHIRMHKNEEMEYSLREGPYDENLFSLDFMKDILLKNHVHHHLQKGVTKGNYNVIVLGADEWFGLNNKTVDNSEYCETHKNEKICRVG